MGCIVIGTERPDKNTLVINGLHKSCSGIEYILVVLRTLVKLFRQFRLSHLARHLCNAIIIKSILQCFGKRPIVGIILIFYIIRNITELLIKPDSPIIVQVGSGNTGLQCFLCIKVTYSFQISIHNDGNSMIANHHISLTTPKVPNRKPAVLVIKSKKRLYHVIGADRLGISKKRMGGTISIP